MERNVTLSIVRIIVRRRHQTLFVKSWRHKETGAFELPGGKVEICETLFSAARRELKEETGLVLVTANTPLIYYRRTPFDTAVKHAIFVATHYYGQLVVSDTDEIIETKWFKQADRPTLDEHTRYLELALEGKVQLWQ